MYLSVPSIAIIIPSYNYAQYLPEAIESALNQTYPCAVVVVDDGSTDNTIDLYRKYPEVTFLYKENGGNAAGARNYGVERTDADFIITLDADDILDPDFAKKTLIALIENNADFVNIDGTAFNGEQETALIGGPLENAILENNYLPYCALIKKSVWEKLGGQDADIPYCSWEDWTFWIKAFRAGAKQTYLPESLFRYRLHSDSETGKITDRMEKLQQWMIAKGYK